MKSLFLGVVAWCFFFAAGVVRADDHGDTQETATRITSTDTAGTLDTVADEDWFRIDITKAGLVWFYTTGNTDTRGDLYPDAGNRLKTNDDDGESFNFLFDTVLQPGTYYVRIYNGNDGNLTGAYTLSIRTFENATPFVTPNLDASLGVLGDLDLYRIDITQASPAWIYTTGNIDTRGTLYTDAGNRLGGNDDGGGSRSKNFLFSLVLQPGTYYLLVDDGNGGNLTGAYTLGIRIHENATPFNTPNLDASLGVLGDVDFYRIDITQASPAWIYTTGPTDTSGTLYTDSGNRLDGDDDDGAGFNFLFDRVLQPGTYYLLVEDGGSGSLAGAYTLSIRAPVNATPIVTPNLDASLGVLGDLDLYRIDITQPGPAWFFTTGTTDTRGTLYTDSGNRLDGNDDSGAGFNYLFSRTMQPGTYYLLVDAGGSGNLTGNYNLAIRNRTYATPLFGNGSSTHGIEALGDLDLFVFASTGGRVKFFTTGATDTDGTIYDSAGNFAAGGSGAANAGAGDNFLIRDDLIPGLYYLLVQGQTLDGVTGNYELNSVYASAPLIREGPDSLVGFSASNLAGSEIYNTTGAGQTVGTAVSRGSSKSAVVAVQNDATVTTSFGIRGTPNQPGFKVRYFEGPTEITAAVIAGTHIIPDVPSGQSVLLKVKVTVKAGAVPGAKVKCAITATSLASPSLQDTVRVKVTAR